LAGMAVLTTGSRHRYYLAAEYAGVFFGAVVLYGLVAADANPIPVLLLLGAASAVYLARKDRKALWRFDSEQLPPALLLWGITAATGMFVTALLVPGALFRLPHQEHWTLLLVVYPLLSVYPQELIFRAFLFERYAPLFGTGWPMLAASSTAFGFVHVVYGHWLPVVASAIGGWIFAARYRRTRSLVAVSIEHSLYGLLMFMLGLGEFFLSG
jgi:uncharacterized protein